jgi:hypothetical protein
MSAINHDDYQISYDPATAFVTLSGTFRMRQQEYEPVVQLLNEAADARPVALTLDVRRLDFLNSVGISSLSRFVLRVRQHHASALTVKGSNAISWQRRSLQNLQRLMPELQLEFEE